MEGLGYLSASEFAREEYGLQYAAFLRDQAEADLEMFREIRAGKDERVLELGAEAAENLRLFARQRLDLVQERLDKLEEQIGFCTMTAPHDGRVLYVTQYYGGLYRVREGSEVYKGVGLFVLADLSALEVEVNVHERHAGILSVGLAASVTFDAFPGRSYRGRVKKIELMPKLDTQHLSQWRNMVSRVVLDEPPPDGLFPEMLARVEFRTGPSAAQPTIPCRAVGMDREGTFCVVRSRGRWERRRVSVGRGDPDRLVLEEGPAVGSVVLLDPRPAREGGR
jgi:multidrug efflux pump subunit AcrA (membrane-fusion protein)